MPRFSRRRFGFSFKGPRRIETAPANASPPLANKTNAEIGAPTELLPRAGSPQLTTDRRSANSGDEDNSRGSHGRGIDKSVLAISEPRRYRDKAHLKFVARRLA